MPAIDNLLANITPADLTAFAREVPIRQDFTLTQRILPVRVIDNVKWRTRNESITVAAARYRAFNAPTPRIRTSGTRSVREGYLPPLGALEEIEEFEMILDEIARGADDRRLLDGLWNNVERQVLSMRARLELAAGDVLADGVLTIEENGQFLPVDFGTPSANVFTVATLWSDTENARPLDDEMAALAVLDAAGKPRPAEGLTTSAIIALFARSRQYREAFWGGEVTGTSRPNLNPAQVEQVRQTYGLPALTRYEVQVPVADEATGVITSERVLPTDRIIYVPPAPDVNLGETTFGLTAEGIALSMGQNPGIVRQDAPGLISTSKADDNPVSVATKTSAVAMPLLHVPDGLVSMKVI